QLCSPEVDEIVARGLQTTGEKRRKATLEAEAAILRLNSGIPLVHERVVQAEAGTFSNFVRDPLERRLITEYTTPTGALQPYTWPRGAGAAPDYRTHRTEHSLTGYEEIK